MRLIIRCASMLLLLSCAACNTQSHRARQYSAHFQSYEAKVQQRLLAGIVELGDTREMVYIALGSPMRQVRLGAIEDVRERWEYLGRWEEKEGAAVLRTSNDFSWQGLIPSTDTVIWLVEFHHNRVVFVGEDLRERSERPPIYQRLAPMNVPRKVH